MDSTASAPSSSDQVHTSHFGLTYRLLNQSDSAGFLNTVCPSCGSTMQRWQDCDMERFLTEEHQQEFRRIMGPGVPVIMLRNCTNKDCNAKTQVMFSVTASDPGDI